MERLIEQAVPVRRRLRTERGRADQGIGNAQIRQAIGAAVLGQGMRRIVHGREDRRNASRASGPLIGQVDRVRAMPRPRARPPWIVGPRDE